MTLLRDHKRTEHGKPHAYRGAMCTFFEGATISVDRFFPHGVSKRVLQWCSKCYCVASVTRAFKGYKLDTLNYG
jgi:hypothetical protein